MTSQPQPIQSMSANGFVFETQAKTNQTVGTMSSLGKITSLGLHLLTLPCSCFCGFVQVAPREEAVISYWGKPVMIISEPGTSYSSPIGRSIKVISTAIQDVKINDQKINDISGNPLIVSALINWRIVDSQKAAFNVIQLDKYVADQALPVIRSLVSRYPYDSDEQHKDCLRRPTEEMMKTLATELNGQLELAGVEVTHFSFTGLSYSDEVAGLLLARQQAEAHLKAKRLIAEGVVGIALETLGKFEEKGLIFTNDEKKAAATKLMFVLTNTSGTIFQI